MSPRGIRGAAAAPIVAIALAAPLAAHAQQQQLRAEWSKSVTEYRGQVGRRVTVVCPPQGQVSDVWGTDQYTDDSPVCSAAVHAGVLTPAAGGAATIVIGAGRPSYSGSARNGVTSKDFGQWEGSFSFAPASEIGRVDWTTTAGGLSTQLAQDLTVECPADGMARKVWGTDVYTDDSSICTAAVHAGLITTATGGRVTLQATGAQPSYAASTRNGVQSDSYGSWPNGFRFAGTTASAPASAPATSPTAPATTTPTTTTLATAPLAGARAVPTAPVAVQPQPTTAAVLQSGVQPTSATTIASRGGTTTAPTGVVTSGAAPTTAVATMQPPSTRPASVTSALPAMRAPTNVRADPLFYRGTVMVHWDTMPGATGYQIVLWLPDGRYAGAMPTGVASYGPERSQGITRELASTTPLSFSVIAEYPQGSSPPSAPASATIPRWYGTYRVSVLGFTVDRETLDDPFETDGKRDEVYLRSAAAERGPDGNQYGTVIERQTLVHGDVNATDWRSATSPNRRVRAGSASADGGLKTGDGFPSRTPWQRTTTSSYTNTFPLEVWQGSLVQGYNSVQVAFNLWESDQRPGQSVPSYASFSPEASALSRAAPATARLQPTLAGKVLVGIGAGVVAAPAVVPLLVLSAPALVPTVAAYMVAESMAPRLPVVPKVATPLDGLYDAVGITAGQMALSNALDGAANALLVGASNYVADMESNLNLTLNVKDRPLGVRQDAQNNLSALPGMLTLTFENAESEALAGNGPAGKAPGIYAYTFTDTITSQGGNGSYTVYVQVERVQ